VNQQMTNQHIMNPQPMQQQHIMNQHIVQQHMMTDPQIMQQQMMNPQTMQQQKLEQQLMDQKIMLQQPLFDQRNMPWANGAVMLSSGNQNGSSSNTMRSPKFRVPDDMLHNTFTRVDSSYSEDAHTEWQVVRRQKYIDELTELSGRLALEHQTE
jgi:hypothetical protein